MKQITIALQGMAWSLLFNSDENYTAAKNELLKQDDAFIDIGDDFGQRVLAFRGEISGVMFEDMDMSKEAHIARAIYNAHVQIATQDRAEFDPTIGAASRKAQMRQGAPIMSPFPGNGRMS